jgi:hypothetical protein
MATEIVRFEDFELDRSAYELRRRGAPLISPIAPSAEVLRSSEESEQSLVRAMELSKLAGVSWEKTRLALYDVLFVCLTRPVVPRASEISQNLVALADEQRSIDHLSDAETWLACAWM